MTWELWDYVLVGVVLSLVMLALGYGIGVLWQKWRDGRKRTP